MRSRDDVRASLLPESTTIVEGSCEYPVPHIAPEKKSRRDIPRRHLG